PQIASPQQLPLQVVCVETLRAEERDHHLSVRRWSRTGVGRLDVPLLFRSPFVCDALPHDLSGLAVETNQLPLLHADVVGRGSLAIQTPLERGVRAAADGRRDEYLVSPDDGARMRQSRYACLP